MLSFTTISSIFAATLLASSTFAAPVDTLVGRVPSGFLNTPTNGTVIANALNNGVIPVNFSPIHAPWYTSDSIDVYLTPYPVADFGAFIKNGVKIASQITGADTTKDILANFSVRGVCGPHYLVIVENQTFDGKYTSNVVDTPFVMIQCLD